MSTYISLTTVPDRLHNWQSAKRNLISLLTQKTQHNYTVLFNIPKIYGVDNIPYPITDELIEITKQYPNFIINQLDRDYGAVTKIIGALLYTRQPDDILIVCDDDHEYHEDMLEVHLENREKYKGQKCAIAFRGDVPLDKRSWVENGQKKYVMHVPPGVTFPVLCDSQLLMPGHWHSVSYTRDIFDDTFLSDSFLSKSVNDDVLVGVYFKQKQYPIYCVYHHNFGDMRPVNHLGRGSSSFPIKEQLPFNASGMHRFRANGHVGFVDTETWNFLHHHDTIYTE